MATISTKEINRATKLRCGKNIPEKIMYNKKEVQFLAKGDDTLPDDTAQCRPRWQRRYDKLYPSQVYGNWFNYKYFDVSYGSSTPVQNCLKWLDNYNYRNTIESTINGTDIVKLINGNTLNAQYHHPHLDISSNMYYDKYRALRYNNYSYSYQVFGPLTLNDNSYETEYWDVRHFSGYSVSRNFLNSVNGFSISFTIHLVSYLYPDVYSYTNTGPLTLISTRLLDSSNGIIETLNMDLPYTAASALTVYSGYPTKYVFANIKYRTGDVINPDGAFVQTRLRTDINSDHTKKIVDKLFCENLDGFCAPNVDSSYCNYELYPNVTVTLTCDKKDIKIYLNGQLYSSRNIESIMDAGGSFFDIDLLMERNITLDGNGNITQQQVVGSAYTQLYNLHVFSECLSAEQVWNVFSESKKYLSVSYYYQYENKDRPGFFYSSIIPKSTYQAPISNPVKMLKETTYYALLYCVTEPSFKYTRAENVTNDIIWTFDNINAFTNGGDVTAHLSYTQPDYGTASYDYNITVLAP